MNLDESHLIAHQRLTVIGPQSANVTSSLCKRLLVFVILLVASCVLEEPSSVEPVQDAGPAAAVCGDGIQAIDEACDEPSLAQSNCQSDCSVTPCGTEFAYQALWIRGFRVCLAQQLEDADAGLAAQALAALDEDIEQVAASLPVSALAYLKRVTIWLEHEQPFPGGVYHPSVGWLRNNGYPEAWAEGVMLGNAANYMSWVEQQPAMVLHELAHAWHHQRLGYDHQGIQAAYEAAVESGIYDQVAYVSGGTQEAYAKTNKMEYFAELTESWFWSNDFYPFVRSELLEHDEPGARIVEESWTIDD